MPDSSPSSSDLAVSVGLSRTVRSIVDTALEGRVERALHLDTESDLVRILEDESPRAILLGSQPSTFSADALVHLCRSAVHLATTPIVIVSSREGLVGAHVHQVVLGDAFVSSLQAIVDDAKNPASASAGEVLVVDDSAALQRLCAAFLTNAGFTVRIASDGWEALDQLARRPVDAVLLDLEMPELDGRHVVRRLQSTRFDRPVLAMTAHAEFMTPTELQRLGFAGFVVKPIDRQNLVDRVHEAVAPARIARANSNRRPSP